MSSAFFAIFAVFYARRSFDRSIDRRVARAAAEIARQAGLHLVHRRPLAERDGRHDHAGRADAALRAAVLNERVLQRVTAAQSLDRRHARAGYLGYGDEAGIH